MDKQVTKLDGGGVWWAADGNLWANDGRIALPDAATREEAEASVLRFNDGEFFCCGCQEWHDRPASGQRFAGLYCREAWEAYKAANSRTCAMCRQPIYNCYC